MRSRRELAAAYVRARPRVQLPEFKGRPHFWAPFSYVNKRLEAVVAELVSAANLTGGQMVVDFGCGRQPYRQLLPPSRYIGVDLADNPLADLHLGPDGTSPLSDVSADLILSTQVLEHVPDPASYLSECHRMLRPGGNLILTTHGIMFLHPHPTDYWRWTRDGLRLATERAGFSVVEERGVMSLAAGALQLLQHDFLMRSRPGLHRVIGAVFQLLIRLADRSATEDGRRDNGFVLAVLAIKPTLAQADRVAAAA